MNVLPDDALPPEGGAQGAFAGGRELVIVRVGDRLHAYENRCPHKGTSLDWSPGRFLSSDGAYLQCATHGALFRLDDGMCVYGPCEGEALTRVPLRRHEGRWCLEEIV